MSILRGGGWSGVGHPINTDFEINWASPQSKGLVVWAPMSDAQARVERVNNRPIYWSGSPGVFEVTADRGWAPNFNGTDAKHFVDRLFTNNLPLTMMAWGRQSSASSIRVLVGVGGDFYLATYDSDDAIIAQEAGSWAKTTSSIPPVGTWFHAAGVFASSTLRHAYMNGGNRGSGVVSRTSDAGERVSIGSTASVSPGLHFAGSLSDIRVYDRALSDAEVHDCYANPWDLYLPRQRVWPVSKEIVSNKVAVPHIATRAGIDNQGPINTDVVINRSSHQARGLIAAVPFFSGTERDYSLHPNQFSRYGGTGPINPSARGRAWKGSGSEYLKKDHYSDLMYPYTMMSWAKLDTKAAADATVGLNDDLEVAGAWIYYSSAIDEWLFGNTGSDDSVAVYSGIGADVGRWQHIAAYIRADNDRGIVIDGTHVVTDSTPVGQTGTDIDTITIGAYDYFGGTVTAQFKGQLQDARVYNRVLSLREIQECAFSRGDLYKPRARIFTGADFDTPNPEKNKIVAVPRIKSWSQQRNQPINTDFRINWASPQAKGLVVCVPFSDGRLSRNLVNGEEITRWGTPAIVGSDGRGRVGELLSASSEAIELPYNEGKYNPRTFTVWAYHNTPFTAKYLFGIGFDGSSNTQILQADGTNVWMRRLGSVDASATATATVGADQWFHATGITNGDSFGACFLNGRNKGTNSTLCTHTVGWDKTRIGAGCATDIGATLWDGYVADARIYDRVLSDAEVYEVYSNPWDLYLPNVRQSWAVAKTISDAPSTTVKPIPNIAARAGGWKRQQPINTDFELNTGSPQAKGLIAAVPFSDGTKNDYSNTGRVWTHNSNLIIQPGERGLSWRGTGTEYMLSPHIRPRDFYPYTLMAWANINYLTNPRHIVGIYDEDEWTSCSIEYGIADPSWDAIYYAEPGGGGDAIATSEGVITPEQGKWYHVAGTFTSLSLRELIVNGTHVFTNTDVRTLGTPTNPTRMSIGAEAGTVTQLPFRGWIQDARVYDRVLSRAEILECARNPWDLYRPRAKTFLGVDIDNSTKPVPINRSWAFHRKQPINTDFRINWQSPQAKGLCLWVPFSDGQMKFDLFTRSEFSRFASPVIVVDSKRGRVLKCVSGNSQYLETADAPLLNAYTPLSITGWATFADTGSDTIVSIGDSAESTSLNLLYYSVPPGWAAFALGTPSNEYAAASGTTPVDGTWSHGAAVFPNKTDRYSYRDGGNKGSDSQLTDLSGVPDQIRIGALAGTSGPSTYRDGLTSDVRVYNRVLSDAEVYDIYSNPWDLYMPNIRTGWGAASIPDVEKEPGGGFRSWLRGILRGVGRGT